MLGIFVFMCFFGQATAMPVNGEGGDLEEGSMRAARSLCPSRGCGACARPQADICPGKYDVEVEFSKLSFHLHHRCRLLPRDEGFTRNGGRTE